jgi:HEAT repeat protein
VDKITKDDHRESEKKADIGHLSELLKKTKEPGAAAQVATLLKDQPGDVVAGAANILGDLGDKSVVPQLSDAVDLSHGAGADKATEEANHANKAIADALGRLGDKSAGPALVKLLRSKDNYTLISTIEALGEVRANEGVDSLVALTTDQTVEPFITKKAIMALGEIGDPKAIPAVHKMLFKERKDKGISFFAESSFALYQIGKPSADILLSDAKGSDKEFKAWAKENEIQEGAIYAKAAQILGDLNVPSAEGTLLSLLNYKDADERMQLVTRMQAADALGRMRSKAAVAPLSNMMGEEEANARATYTRALAFIGDKSGVAGLLKSAKTGPVSARQFAFKNLAFLGNGSADLKAYDDLLKDEPKLEQGECKTQGLEEAECSETIKKDMALFNDYKAALAANCGDTDIACWSKQLEDKNVYVRTKAALMLGHTGKSDAFAPLFAVVQKPFDAVSDQEVAEQDNARFAAIMGVHWLLDAGVKPPGLAELADKLDKQVDDERKKTATQRSAEDVKRLSVRLHRAATAS